MSDKLPPIPQDYFDDNRSRFGGETSGIDLKKLQQSGCAHNAVHRIASNEVRCQCGMGWYDNGHFIIKDGSITGIK